MPNGNKPMYQPWVEVEFIEDEVVQSMNSLQRWMYRTLLQKAFICSTRPNLPNDNNQLWMLAGCENKQQWMENKAIILKKFEVLGLVLVHKRLSYDYENWAQLVEKKRFAADCRWNAPALQNGTSAFQVSKEVRKKESEVRGMQKAQFPETKITAIWEEMTGRVAESKTLYKKELRELIRVNGEEMVLGQFEIWAGLNKNTSSKRPISTFIKQYHTGNVPQFSINMSAINDLAVQLSLISDGAVTFNRLNLQGLAGLLAEFSQEEIIIAFKKFYSENEQDAKWAAKDFIEKASQYILVAKVQKEQQNKKEQHMETVKQQIEAEKVREMAANEAQEAQDETLALDAFNLLGETENDSNSPPDGFTATIRKITTEEVIS